MADEFSQTPSPLETGQTFSSAAAALQAYKRQEAAAEAPAPKETPVEAPRVEAPAETPAAETPSEASTDDNAVEEGADALPPIDAPSSFTSEEKEAFKNLPRNLQETLARRQSERERATSKAMQEAAEKRKAADADREAAQKVSQHYLQQLQTYIPVLQQKLAGEFSDIKTLADAQTLADTDPARWARWSQAQQLLHGAVADQRRIVEENREKASHEHREYVRAEREKLIEKLPELHDDAKFSTFSNDLGKYLKNEGFNAQEIEALTDHRTALVARKAMLYDRAQAAKTAAAVKPIPKVQVPGAGSSKAGSEAQTNIQKFDKALKNGADLRELSKFLRAN